MTSTRVAFVSNPYRYAIAEDSNVITSEPGAREIIVDTNLGEAAAAAVAAEYLAALKGAPLAFEVTVSAIIDLDDYRGCPPLFRVSAPGYTIGQDRVFRVIGSSCNYLTGRTTLRVRG